MLRHSVKFKYNIMIINELSSWQLGSEELRGRERERGRLIIHDEETNASKGVPKERSRSTRKEMERQS